MIRIIKSPESRPKKIISMADMKPLQIGKILSHYTCHDNHIVIRTTSSEKFEVMDLFDPGTDSCWTGENAKQIYVELLKPGEKITLEIFNEE